MKLGQCPVCFEEIDKAIDKNIKFKISQNQNFDCPYCGTELFIESLGSKTKFRLPHKNPKHLATLTIGMEIESFSIDINKLEVKTKTPYRPKYGIEKDEEFSEDMTIGSEYNSAVFSSINEALFRIKTGLRKYLVNIEQEEHLRLALIGTYAKEDTTAGVHYHVGFGKKKGINQEEARFIAPHIHQQIPFLIAITANSPIIKGKITNLSSNRLIYNGEFMFDILNRNELKRILIDTSHLDEISFSRKIEGKKPPTLEVRVADSNLPEYIIAGLFIVYISTLGALKGKKLWRYYRHEKYEIDRLEAGQRGAKASIHWDKAKFPISKYIDVFFNYYKEEIKSSNTPQDVLDVFRLAKTGWIMADIIREAYKNVEEKLVDKGEEEIQRQFILKFLDAQQRNLNGENLITFCKNLSVKIPNLEKINLGKMF
ncbi:MAG: hypothetical protein EAX96_02245 [Candidatus Lokiarchaeota archaeon]|nr:hypothetical protein [Candidatus Lokiarchaeota archaeon]